MGVNKEGGSVNEGGGGVLGLTLISSSIKNHKLVPFNKLSASCHSSLLLIALFISVFLIKLTVVPSGTLARSCSDCETVIFSEGTEKIIWEEESLSCTKETRARLPAGEVAAPRPPPNRVWGRGGGLERGLRERFEREWRLVRGLGAGSWRGSGS